LFGKPAFATVEPMLRSFDDLGTPLHEVTFCVVDLETTGGSADACEITEVGAARFRGGESLGTFQTLVNPGAPIAPAVSALTGITDTMVRPAPLVSEVLPTLAEFVGGSVLVGHNLRFDVSFLDAALIAGDRSPVGLRTVDTVALARRLVRGDVPDCRLGTLAHLLDLDHRPTHRALDDVLATADLLHVLLERAAAFGVTLLDDLLQFPRLAAHPHVAKLPLTNRLPRSPGAYVLRDGQGRALHVGSAADDLRRRVRSLFAGDDQRAAGRSLRELHAIDHIACASPLAAAVAEIRLVQALRPRRSARFAGWQAYCYVKLGAGRTPRLSVARAPGARGARHLGPLPSAAAARAVIEAVESVAFESPGTHPSAPPVPDASPSASPGDAAPPKAGADDRADRRPGDGDPASALFDDPASVLSPLHRRIAVALDAGRYAHAARLQTMAAALVDAVSRQRRFDSLRRAERVVLGLPDGGGVELNRGRLVRAWADAADARAPGPAGHAGGQLTVDPVELPPDDGPLPLAMADELSCVVAWLDRHAHRLLPLHVEGDLSSTLPRLPSFRRADSAETTNAGLAACSGDPARRGDRWLSRHQVATASGGAE
jgi:DNA polymerase-3 subunit epsilon